MSTRRTGHTDLDTTQRYAHLSKGHSEDAQKKIERFRARQRSRKISV
jgi:site-specific recombinase XerD